MSKRIGIDLDDTVMNTLPTYLNFCNREYGEQFAPQHFVDPLFYTIWGITSRQGLERWIAFNESGEQENIVLVEGAKEIITRLARHHELHAITGRAVEHARITREWINKHLPGVFTNVHFCSKAYGAEYHQPKGALCKSLGIKLHIDDHPKVAKECIEKGVNIILFNQPWNQQPLEESNPLLARALHWSDKPIKALLPEQL